MSMHADEDSDEVVVPAKRSNKEDLSSAEIVEGRASPKGNGGQATAVRTPSRGYRFEPTGSRAPSGATN